MLQARNKKCYKQGTSSEECCGKLDTSVRHSVKYTVRVVWALHAILCGDVYHVYLLSVLSVSIESAYRYFILNSNFNIM